MATEVIMPKVDMDMETGTIASWHVADGDFVEEGSALFDIETDKATMEVEAPASGRLQITSGSPGTEIAIGTAIAWILADGEQPQPTALEVEAPGPAPAAPDTDVVATPSSDASPPKQPDTTASSTDGRVRATPLARRIARQSALDLTAISGSGPRGRIISKDLQPYLDNASAEMEETTGAANPVAPQPPVEIGDAPPHDRLPLTRMRATIAARLTQAKTTVPHFYLDADCQLDALFELRERINATLPGADRISVNDFLIKASALTLQKLPDANASWAGDAILRYHAVDISIAVAVEGGLVTPVVRNAAERTLTDIARETKTLTQLARDNKLPSEAFKGGSLSISNLGMFGVKSFTAIINPPQSMIVAVGQSRRIFVPDADDRPVAATILPVTLSCDHRVMDGAFAAQWLQQFKAYIEEPLSLLV